MYRSTLTGRDGREKLDITGCGFWGCRQLNGYIHRGRSKSAAATALHTTFNAAKLNSISAYKYYANDGGGVRGGGGRNALVQGEGDCPRWRGLYSSSHARVDHSEWLAKSIVGGGGRSRGPRVRVRFQLDLDLEQIKDPGANGVLRTRHRYSRPHKRISHPGEMHIRWELKSQSTIADCCPMAPFRLIVSVSSTS